jgi:ubiquinone/menaquinone biosynthesis C-methylase UbiE
MQHRVCPWWLGYCLASPLRRFWQDPAQILQPYVHSGMTVVEPGPGMGFFTLELARLVGPSGRVVAVDLQPKMLEGLKRRLVKAGLADRVDCRLATPDSLGIADLADNADLVVAFAVVHEMPSTAAFFLEAAQCLKRHGTLLFAEPGGHVTAAKFEEELRYAAAAGLRLTARPAIGSSRTALLERE